VQSISSTAWKAGKDVLFTEEDIRRLLHLEPLPGEGGFFRETYRSAIPMYSVSGGERSAASAIYYLLTPGIFSALHRLPGDEMFHFYLGDVVEMLQLHPAGQSRIVMIGNDLRSSVEPQVVVPGGVWQGCRLRAGGRFALMGTTMSPGFDLRDFQAGNRNALCAEYPSERERILALTHP
jgi:predicted cupin superfamily sugar epimerase